MTVTRQTAVITAKLGGQPPQGTPTPGAGEMETQKWQADGITYAMQIKEFAVASNEISSFDNLIDFNLHLHGNFSNFWAALESQIEFGSEKDFRVITVEELGEAIESGETEEMKVLKVIELLKSKWRRHPFKIFV